MVSNSSILRSNYFSTICICQGHFFFPEAGVIFLFHSYMAGLIAPSCLVSSADFLKACQGVKVQLGLGYGQFTGKCWGQSCTQNTLLVNPKENMVNLLISS